MEDGRISEPFVSCCQAADSDILATFRHLEQATLRRFAPLLGALVLRSTARVQTIHQTAADRMAGEIITCGMGGTQHKSRTAQVHRKKGPYMQDKMPNILPSGLGSFSKEAAAPEPGGTRYGNLGTGYQTTVYEGLAIKHGRAVHPGRGAQQSDPQSR